MSITSSRSSQDDTPRYLDGRLEYAVRVRGTIYIWGSAGIAANVTFATPPILHVANDRHGEEVSISTQAAGAGETVLGALQPGEMLSFPIQTITGVSASCDSESIVRCVISVR
jgi:hypothetical protein